MIGHPETLREVPGDYLDDDNTEMAWILALRGWRTTLPAVDDFIEKMEAEGAPVATHLREQRSRALRLYRQFKESGHHTNGIEDTAFFWVLESIRTTIALIRREDFLLPLAKHGKGFKSGRKVGTKGPIRKAIAKHLKANPKLTTETLWGLIKDKPPRGWHACESSRMGRYFEGPTPLKEMKYRRFATVCSEERKAAKITG